VVIVVLLAYCTLFSELVFLHVPSVASVYQLVFSKKSIINFNNSELQDCRLKRVLQWPSFKKILLLALPTFISIITGLLPLMYLAMIYGNKATWHNLNSEYSLQHIAGILCIITGRTLTIYSTFEIRKSNRQKEDSFDLKTDGIFGFSRNPLLLGMYVMYAGMLIIFPTITFISGMVVYLANMHFRVLLEEDFLYHQFGNKFIHYRQKTKRY
jgi:protein-S-isoprenylcysteine O-methyltransferase Ste14